MNSRQPMPPTAALLTIKDSLETSESSAANLRENHSMNPVITNAINALNDQREANVESEAMVLIGRIQNEQAQIKANDAQIESYRTELDKVRKDVIDQKSVLGTTLPADGNPNEVTIAKAIADLNRARQSGVESQAISLTNAITGKQATIKANEANIAELRSKLLALKADVVSETVVTG